MCHIVNAKEEDLASTTRSVFRRGIGSEVCLSVCGTWSVLMCEWCLEDVRVRGCPRWVWDVTPCQDYRYLNEHTKPNSYPLPLILDLMIKLKNSKYFTKLDLRWGYNNIWIKEGDEWKATFVTNRGLFEPTVMFFGLWNSPAMFQAMMDDYFRDLVDKGWIVIYMDDILIHGQTEKQLEEWTKQVLAWLQDHDLYLNWKNANSPKKKLNS